MVIVVGLGAFVMLGGGGGNEPAAAPEASAPGQPSAPPKSPAELKLEAAEKWWRAALFDDVGQLQKSSVEDMHAVLKTVRAREYDKLAGFHWKHKQDLLFKMLLRLDPDDLEANRARGRIPLTDFPDFWDVAKRFLRAKTVPEDLEAWRNEFDGTVDLRKRRGKRRTPFVTQEEFERISVRLSRFLEYERKLSADPQLARMLAALKRIKLHPILGHYDAVHRTVHPFVIFYASRELVQRNESPEEAARVEAKRRALRERAQRFEGLVKDLLAFWRERWIDPLKLPAFKPEDLLYVWIFEDRESFEEYGAKMGMPVPPYLLGYFSPTSHWAFVCDDQKDGERVQDTLAHELTHALHWHFSKARKKGPILNYFKYLQAVWFSEGWAEYVGWGKTRNGKREFAQISRPRLNSLHQLKQAKLPFIPIERLVQQESYHKFWKWARDWLAEETALERGLEADYVAKIYLEVLYAQSWAFMMFLYEHEGGKYRDRIMKYTGASLRAFRLMEGKQGYVSAHEAFGRIFGLKHKGDWKHLDNEFGKYLDGLLRKYPATD